MAAVTISLQSAFYLNFSSVLSIQELKNKYLVGIPLPTDLTDETIQFFIDASISELENFLSLRFRKQIIKEEKSFTNNDWMHWGYMNTTFPVVCPVGLEGYLGTVKQVTYPVEWLSSRKTNDNRNYSRVLNLVPIEGSTQSGGAVYSGIVPLLRGMLTGSSSIPNYWTIEYVTGWDQVPAEILDCIGMLTSYKVLQLISDALMSGAVAAVVNNQGQTVLQSNGSMFGGIGFGMSSKSVSLDGLSQSVSTYANGTTGVWGARMKQYQELLNPDKPMSLLGRLRDQYTNLVMAVC